MGIGGPSTDIRKKYNLGRKQWKILRLLEANLVMTTRRLVKLLGTNYANLYKSLLALKDKGLVDDVYCIVVKPKGGVLAEVRYWYLKDREKEVMKWLESNSHILLVRRQKF